MSKDRSGQFFIHPHRRCGNASSDVRGIRQFEQTLDTAVFPTRSVQERKHDVERAGTHGRAVPCHEVTLTGTQLHGPAVRA